jgi:nucleoside-diphosphate-sugar epimerase
MAKILVVGGAGFIGHNVVRILESRGHECLVLDNLTDYGFVPEAEMAYLQKHRRARFQARVVEGDIRDHECVEKTFAKFRPDTVIHLASFPRQKVVEAAPIVAADVMMGGLTTLLEAAKKYSTKRFVYISSSMVYGDFVSAVQPESAHCEPIGQYGIFKLAGEWLVKDYSRTTGMEYSIVRPSAVYGEWDVEDRVVSKFVTAAMRGETLAVKGVSVVLDFTYVDDAAAGIALAATVPGAAGNTYNITKSGEHQYTLLEAAALAVKVAGKGRISQGERDLSFPNRGRLSIDRAVAELGYAPTVDVPEGFKRYYQWYSEHPMLWKK